MIKSLATFVIILAIQNGFCDDQWTKPTETDSKGFCTNGELKADLFDCTSYFECVDGRYKLRLCNTNTFYDPAEQQCRSNYVCPNVAVKQEILTVTQTVQQACNDGDIRTDSDNCSVYWECKQIAGNYKYIKKICPYAQRFSIQLKRCIPGLCSNTITSTRASPATSKPCEESGGLSGFRADNIDARRYFQCAQGRWVHMDCPTGLVWNPRALVCDWPKKTVCDTAQAQC